MKSSNAKPESLKRMLNAAVKRLVDAEIADSESGMYPPETWSALEKELKLAKVGYNRIRDQIFERIS